MDTLLTILYGVLILSFLVVIHEAGHYCAARAFGVRVSEFMIGLPGPNIGFKRGETKFGITPILLGGYARICGMETGPESPYLRPAMMLLFRRGSLTLDELMRECSIPEDDEDDAAYALEELVEWGCAVGPKRRDAEQRYLAEAKILSKKERKADGAQGVYLECEYERGQARVFDESEEEAVYQHEFRRQYRSLPFWKRSIIVCGGPFVNLVFALLAFVIIFSVIGFDYTYSDGVTRHVTVDPLRACYAGVMYIGMVIQAVAQLFNPATTSQVISDSASVIGIAVISKQAADAGLVSLLEFVAMISVSLGIMNMVPIPPLDGGRFVIEIYQKIARHDISMRALNVLTFIGMALFLLLFVVMVNQDVSRFIFGNWG